MTPRPVEAQANADHRMKPESGFAESTLLQSAQQRGSPAVSEQGEREAFLQWARTAEVGPDESWAFAAFQAGRASLRASPAVPVAQDERADALSIAMDALDEIALAGMSGTGMESEEAMREWHARQAWKFIGIAARAKEAARAALSAATPPAAVPMSQKTQDGHSTSRSGEAPTVPAAWTTYAHIHAIGFGKSGLFVKKPGGPFCVPVFFGEAQHINEGFNDNV